jgi:hypothetical protein
MLFSPTPLRMGCVLPCLLRWVRGCDELPLLRTDTSGPPGRTNASGPTLGIGALYLGGGKAVAMPVER